MSPTHSRQRAIRRDKAQKADYSFKKNLILRFLVKQNRQTFILISSFRTCRDLTRLISNRRCFIRNKVVCCFSTWKEINTFIPNVKCKINNLQSCWHMNVPAEEKPLGFNTPLSLWEFLSFIAHCGTHAILEESSHISIEMFHLKLKMINWTALYVFAVTPSPSTLPKRTDVAKTWQENSQHGITEPPDPSSVYGVKGSGFSFHLSRVCMCLYVEPAWVTLSCWN